MDKKKFYIAVSIIGFLLIVLLYIQFSSTKTSYAISDNARKLEITGALEDIEEKIITNNECFVFFKRSYIDSGYGIYIIKQEWDSSGYQGKPDTVNMLYDYYENNNEEYNERVPFSFADFRTREPLVAEINIRFTYDVDGVIKDAADIDDNTLTRSNFRQLTYNSGSIDEIFNMENVDSIIGAQLLKKGITDDYGFAFINHQTGKREYSQRVSNALDESKYDSKILLFQNSKFIRPYELVLTVPHDNYSAIGWSMGISVLVITLLSIMFIVFVRFYMKQSRLSQMQTDFVNNLTHEFNTPLTNISLAVETIQNSKATDGKNVESILQIISSEANRLQNNIETALNVASIENGSFNLHSELVNVCELLNSIEASYTHICVQQGGSLVIDCNKEYHVRADETHLLNCICNLLDNAIKYRRITPEIKVSVRQNGSYADISVTDNGKGIAKDAQKYVFDKFYRVHEGDKHNTKGFGVGLSYVKNVVNAMGGKVTVSSKPGIGSVFTITLQTG